MRSASSGMNWLGEREHAVVGFARIDAHFFHVAPHQIAQRAQRQRQIFVNAVAFARRGDAFLQRLPQLGEIRDVFRQRLARLPFGIRAHDVAGVALRRQRLQHFLQARAFRLVLDAHGNADHFHVRQQHEIARRHGQIRRQPRALAADRILDDLDDDVLAFAHEFADRRATPAALRCRSRRPRRAAPASRAGCRRRAGTPRAPARSPRTPPACRA